MGKSRVFYQTISVLPSDSNAGLVVEVYTVAFWTSDRWSRASSLVSFIVDTSMLGVC